MARTTPYLTAALSISLSWIGAATASEPQLAQAQPTFEMLDTNSDGKISLNEASVNDALFVAFKDLDKDRDGMLTKEEFAAFKPQRSGA